MNEWIRPTGAAGVHLVEVGPEPGQSAAYIVAGERAAVVDTGPPGGAGRILSALERLGLAPAAVRYLLPTHLHRAHSGGTAELLAACPNAQAVIHQATVDLVVDPRNWLERLQRRMGHVPAGERSRTPLPRARLLPVAGGEALDLGGCDLRVVHAPGHSRNHCCFWLEASRALFVGDACGVCPEGARDALLDTPPPSFMLGQSEDTLGALGALNPALLLFAHFGPHTDAGLLERYADRLTRWVSEVERVQNDVQDAEAVVRHFVGKYGARRPPEEVAKNVRGVLVYLAHRRG